MLHLPPFIFWVHFLRPGWVAALPFWLSLAACGWEVSCPKSIRSWSFDNHKPGASRFLGGDSLYLGLCESNIWPWGVLAFALGKTLLHDYARRASILAADFCCIPVYPWLLDVQGCRVSQRGLCLVLVPLECQTVNICEPDSITKHFRYVKWRYCTL